MIFIINEPSQRPKALDFEKMSINSMKSAIQQIGQHLKSFENQREIFFHSNGELQKLNIDPKTLRQREFSEKISAKGVQVKRIQQRELSKENLVKRIQQREFSGDTLSDRIQQQKKDFSKETK